MIAALIVLLFATANLPWQLEDYDQAKQGHLTRNSRKTHFVEPADAITEWNTRNLDALVSSGEKAAALMRDLQRAALSRLQSNEEEQHEQSRGYVLITR